LDNLLITPHCAWAARETRQRLIDEVFENVQAFRQGERRNRVD
jgi:glycerate dehydrogenase